MVLFAVHPVPVRRLPVTLTETSVLAIIPARYHSSRLPGKALADLAGQPMIAHVYQRACQAQTVDAVVVATDDARIVAAVESIGGHAWLTSAGHPSGTDRLAEVARDVTCGLVVNVQGDEPLIDPASIDAAVRPMLADQALEMATLCRPIKDEAEHANPNIVKVVRGLGGRALYFSRAAIPFRRDTAVPAAGSAVAAAHIGLYVYRRDVLLRLAGLTPTPLERSEALEQLRALEHGISITVVDINDDSIGVDTLDDLERVRQRLLSGATRT